MIDKTVKKIFKHKILVSIASSLLYTVLILPINESASFATNLDRKSSIISCVLKLLFFISFTFFINFLIGFAEKVTNKNKFYKDWIKFFLIYLTIMVVVLLLIYPGHWVWDEFTVLEEVKRYSIFSWQNYFTNIYYTFCLYAFPSGMSIVFIQTFFCSLTFGYLMSQIKNNFNSSRALSVIIFILFLMPPIILNNFYPLRLTVYSYIEVILFTKLLVLYKNNWVECDNKYYAIFKYTVLITILCFWRSEGIFYLLLLPILFIKLKIFSKKDFNKKIFIYLLPSILFFLAGFAITEYTTDKKYILASMINPLSIMIQSDLNGKNINNELEEINRTIDLSIVRANPSYIESPSFWMGAVRENYNETVNTTIKDFLIIVFDNFGAYLNARIKTFLATNSLDYSDPMSISPLMMVNNDAPTQEKINQFYNANYFSRPLNIGIKYNVTKFLLMLSDKSLVSIIRKVVWSIIPTSITLFILFIVSLIKRHKIFSLLMLFIFTRMLIIFIMAPAHYFMYYLPIYISGNFIALIYIIQLISNKRKGVNLCKKY